MPLKMPAAFTAGDSLSFVDSLADYSAADGWALSYVLTNGSNTYTVASSASGTDHQVAAATTATVAWVPGPYRWQAYVTKGSDRHTVGRGRIEIRPDFLSSAADPLTHVERTLAALEAMLEGRASQDQQTLTLNGRSLTRMPIEELLRWRDKYRAEAKRLRQAERIAQGLGSGNRILVRF